MIRIGFCLTNKMGREGINGQWQHLMGNYESLLAFASVFHQNAFGHIHATLEHFHLQFGLILCLVDESIMLVILQGVSDSDGSIQMVICALALHHHTLFVLKNPFHLVHFTIQI